MDPMQVEFSPIIHIVRHIVLFLNSIKNSKLLQKNPRKLLKSIQLSIFARNFLRTSF